MVDVPRDELVALLAAPLDEFVAVRTARVKALKAEDRKDEAAALAAVRKPTRLVWALGEVRRRHPTAVAAADEAAAEADAAQSGGGGSLRDALRQFREAVEHLATLVSDAYGGMDPAEAGLAVRSVMVDPDAHRAWIDGVLMAMPVDGGGAPRPRSAGSRARPSKDDAPARRRPVLTVVPPPDDQEDEPEPSSKGTTRQQRRSARQRVQDAGKALAAAEAAEHVAADAVDALEEELAAVAERLERARDELEARREARVDAATAADEARADLDALDSDT
jgi:hypothetical protein